MQILGSSNRGKHGNNFLGSANINNESSFEINIQEGIDSTTIIPDDLNVNLGRAMISFNTENGKLVQVTSNVRKEDTDMIQILTNLDTLVELTKNIPITMEIP
jgi:hypothetical protein